VPDAAEDARHHVEMLDANTLNFGDLMKYDAIVVGVRAYELRSEIAGSESAAARLRAEMAERLWCNTNATLLGTARPTPLIRRRSGTRPGDPLPRITDENSP